MAEVTVVATPVLVAFDWGDLDWALAARPTNVIADNNKSLFIMI
jgi:hypothetical protein